MRLNRFNRLNCDYSIILVDVNYDVNELPNNIECWSVLDLEIDSDDMHHLTRIIANDSENDLDSIKNSKLLLLKDNNPSVFLDVLSEPQSYKNNNVIRLKEEHYSIKVIAGNSFESNAILSRLLDRRFKEEIYNLPNQSYVIKKVIGAEGWTDFNELFYVLNNTVDWLVLRNYKYLPNEFWGNDDDVDMLCSDILKFIDVSFAVKRSPGISGYKIKINNRWVSFDIRFLGDKYYPDNWQIHMLSNRVLFNNMVPIMNKEDLFFSLLYHFICHKHEVKKEYLDVINSLGKELSNNNKLFKDINSLKVKGFKILNKYMADHGYFYEKPFDRCVPVTMQSKELISSYAHGIKRDSALRHYSHTCKRELFKLTPSKMKEFYRDIKK